MAHHWFKNIFGVEEKPDAARNTKIGIETDATTGTVFLKCKVANANRKYIAGRFYLDTLGNIKNEAIAALQQFQRTDSSTWAFPNTLQVLNIVVNDIMNDTGYLCNKDAVFQVASQTNCLEFTSENGKPEDGFTNYYNDLTQGPACSLAAPAGTYIRNYFSVPHGASFKEQTEAQQISTLSELTHQLGGGVDQYFTIRNGYIKMDAAQKTDFTTKLADPLLQGVNNMRDNFLNHIQIGVNLDTEVLLDRINTQLIPYDYMNDLRNKFTVTQVFCSAVSFGAVPHGTVRNTKDPTNIDILAKSILQAQYEATLWVGIINAIQKGINAVYLTKVGGGVFENDDIWIYEAIERALKIMKEYSVPLCVYITHHQQISHRNYYNLEAYTTDFRVEPGIDLQHIKTLVSKTNVELGKLTKKLQKNLTTTGTTAYSKQVYTKLDKCKNEIAAITNAI